MAVTILEAFDAGNDVLLIHATADGVVDEQGDPLLLIATGWVSALLNHFEPAAYQPDGHRDPAVGARPMSAAEQLAYCQERVFAVYPQASPLPVALGIKS